MVEPLSTASLLEEIRRILEDKKAEDVVVLDLRPVSDTLDFFVIATGISTPHLEALERNLKERLEASWGLRPRGVEGPSPRWILLDYDEVLVHLMSREARAYYDLEGFWADAPRLS